MPAHFLDRPLDDFLTFWPEGIEDGRGPTDPSPAEINRMCEEIRKTWSPAIRRQREFYQSETLRVMEAPESCLFAIPLPRLKLHNS